MLVGWFHSLCLRPIFFYKNQKCVSASSVGSDFNPQKRHPNALGCVKVSLCLQPPPPSCTYSTGVRNSGFEQ